jgi:thiol:disulfide interchange protein DsbC
MLRTTLIALLGALSLTACAAEPSGTAAKPTAAKPATAKPATAAAAAARPAGPNGSDALIRQSVAKAIPGVAISSIRPAPMPGFREVALSGRVVYVSDDGKHLIQGTLIRLADRANLTESSEAVLRRDVLATVGKERRIVFPAKVQKHRVTVFTDIDCGFCRKLHSEIAKYNAAGITVEYLFFPRAGINSESYDKAVAVWCAPDRNQALTDAKLDKPVKPRTCANPVAADFELGQKVGVDGTPAIYLDDGTQIGGYSPPEDMLKRIEEHKAAALEARTALACG